MPDTIWGWGILGLILLAAEMLTGTFYILWFGVSALCVALAVGLFPAMPLSVQLFMFAALALGSLAIWKLNYRKTAADSRVGQAQGEEIGRSGTITAAVGPMQAGRIAFLQGVMGSREWAAVADEPLEAGSEAIIVRVEGNSLRVKRK